MLLALAVTAVAQEPEMLPGGRGGRGGGRGSTREFLGLGPAPDAAAAKLGDPTLDPHGDPIPSAELELRERETVPLDALKEGDRGVFVRVSDADPEMLRYLSERGISPGERLQVLECQPFGGPLTVSFERGERQGPSEHALGGALARAMRVELDGATPSAAPSAAPSATASAGGPPSSGREEAPA